MTNKKFKYVIVEDLASGDFIFDAFGETLSDLFVACAEACFSAMTDIDRVMPSKRYSIELREENQEELIYAFISELIYLKDTEKTFFSSVDVDVSPDGRSLKAVAVGEVIDYNKHLIRTDVKAVTHHDLRIRRADGGFMTRMILDL
jgi:SHS2 domain-containing protein